ncbi:MAG: DUF4190 domain-containing protein [Planctomycetota bacterium]|nr:DUF4190 domain-containing protein [Planctomycetota bacterium]
MAADRACVGGPTRRRRTSPWAVASLLCSLALCPPLCVIGPVLGVAGLVRIRRSPTLGGGRMALIGIALGSVLTIVWTAGGLWLHQRNFRPLRYGPVTALEKGFAGDISGFKAEFTGEAAKRPDAEAAAFIDTLRRRYGAFRASRQDRAAIDPESAIDPARPRIPYVFEFDRGFVEAEAVFVRFDEATGRPVFRFDSIVIRDAEGGDFAYPVAALEGEEGEPHPEGAATPTATDD